MAINFSSIFITDPTGISSQKSMSTTDECNNLKYCLNMVM